MKVEITRLTVKEPFKSLFPVEPEVVKALTADMKANGFDAAQTVFAWKAPGGELVLVDGHMRLQAAKAARLKEVFVTVRRFVDEDDAFAFAIKVQRVRRNLTKLQIAEATTRAELARHERTSPRVARFKDTGSPKGQRGGGTGAAKDPIRTAVIEKTATRGVGVRTAERALANVRAENGEAPPPKRASDRGGGRTQPIHERVSDEALWGLQLLETGAPERAAQLTALLKAMFKAVEGLDRKEANAVVSCVWGVVDGAYRDNRKPAELIRLATSKKGAK